MRHLILLLVLLATPAAAQDAPDIACIARTVDNDTATGVYVWWESGQEIFDPPLAAAVAQAIADCGMVDTLAAMPEMERLATIAAAIALIAARGQGLTV